MYEKHLEFIKELGFFPKDNKLNVYEKIYQNKYLISIDLEKGTIDYDKNIKIGDKTTSNLKKEENLVVLECINRLLELGYSAKNLILEKRWKSGHGTSGKLDILVSNEKNIPIIMIECKMNLEELNKEARKMIKNGGQLFSYLNFERSVKYLILYTFDFANKKHINKIVEIKNAWRELDNQDEIHDHWNKNFIERGLLEEKHKLFELTKEPLKEKDLSDLSSSASSKIFNQFAEILRHNVISDKPNAFNKLLNMFVCKIIDENRPADEELAFQIYDDDDDISIQTRLNDLYKHGMSEFLNISIADKSEQDIKYIFENNEIDGTLYENLKNIFNELRLKKNPEFSFIEVFDEESFKENAKVVREIIELLQPYRFRYNHKHQFLGNFFELLLNTSMKQESGQFFTPIPIARFMVKSLPIKSLIDSNIKKNKRNYLPYMIDYAAGSGHFLTEYMDETQKIIENYETDKIAKNIKNEMDSYRTNLFGWAKEYVYGIEKDYRLVKAAKISSFLNGDGDANIIRADGLGSFIDNDDYIGKLKSSNINKKMNENFDILIANPPYSVSGFRNTVKSINDSFELSPYISDTSSEIEVLFLERINHLLSESGMAAVILPTSILNNNGVEVKAREYLLNHFEIIGIIKLGTKTFMATGINTVILFLKKKIDNSLIIKNTIENIFNTHRDLTVNGIATPLQKYIKHYYEDIDLNDYFSMYDSPTYNLINTKMYNEYFNESKLSKDEVMEIEKKKLLYFISVLEQNIIFVDALEKDEEQTLLGYKFSKRRNNEGIHPIKKGKSIDECTLLYSENEDIALNTYIINKFKNRNIEITEPYTKYIQYRDLVDMIDFESSIFDLNIRIKKKINFEELWGTNELIYLRDIASIEKGTLITKDDIITGDIPVMSAGKAPTYNHNTANRPGNIITCSSSGANAGYLNYFSTPIFASDCTTIKSKDESKVSTKDLFDILKEIQEEIYLYQTGSAQPHVYGKDLAKLMLPMNRLNNIPK